MSHYRQGSSRAAVQCEIGARAECTRPVLRPYGQAARAVVAVNGHRLSFYGVMVVAALCLFAACYMALHNTSVNRAQMPLVIEKII
jgi:hypothetical protein